MARISLTSRDREKKGSLMSLEALLLFGLAVVLFLAVWTVGSNVMERADDGSNAYEQSLDELTSNF